jgi:hypothetical protein
MVVVYSRVCLQKVTAEASLALRNLIGHDSRNGKYQIKACCCCDRVIKYGETEFIGNLALKRRTWAKLDKNTNEHMKLYYKYQGEGSLKDSSLEDLLISPRSYYSERRNGSRLEKGFDICRQCNSEKEPMFSIKKYSFGGAPYVLSCLNDVELAMVSQGRIDRHIFQLYAGQHQCISLWHQMHFNDCEHTLASFEIFNEYKLPKIMMCTLSGPFTSQQKAKALKRISVDTSKIMRALIWLVKHNVLYKDLNLPGDNEFPIPVIIDHSNVVDATDSRIETIFETTVIFPQTNNIQENNGGNTTKEAFLRDVLKDKRQSRMISRPTLNAVKLYDGNNLAKCFPLQFPYGTGVMQDKVDILKYLKFIIDVSIPTFQTGQFILPIFNLYAKTQAVRKASMRCKYKLNDTTNTGDVINKITVDELEDRISKLGEKRKYGDRNTQKLVDSVYAISKKLPFTDEAASEERRKLFSMCTRFGLPSIFFTVTPDDLDNFRIRVYSNGTGTGTPPSLHDAIVNV